METTKRTYVPIQDLDGHPVAYGTPCLAERLTDDGVLLVYLNKPDHAQKLVQDLAASGVTNPKLLDLAYWTSKRQECTKLAASKCSQGSCNSGSCDKVYSGGITCCDCT